MIRFNYVPRVALQKPLCEHFLWFLVDSNPTIKQYTNKNRAICKSGTWYLALNKMILLFAFTFFPLYILFNNFSFWDSFRTFVNFFAFLFKLHLKKHWFFALLCRQCCWHFIIFRNNFVRYLTRQHIVSLLLSKTSRYYGGTEVTCLCFYLSCAHNIISQSLNTYIHKCCLKSTDSRNDFILSYWNAKCLYFGTKVYIHCWISSTSFDKFSQSFLFTLVNNKISIINILFFSGSFDPPESQVLLSAWIFTNSLITCEHDLSILCAQDK